jgi:DNA-binding MarR family transcriptional regulator
VALSLDEDTGAQRPPSGGPEAAAAGPPVPAAPEPRVDVAEVERLLREVAAALRHRGRRALGGLGITPPQYDALIQIARGGELAMGELCGRLHLASSTVTDVIARMERGGLVQRFRDPEDRRVVRLRLTPRGRQVIEEVTRTRVAYLRTILLRLPEEEQLRLWAAIRLLHREMTAVTD